MYLLSIRAIFLGIAMWSYVLGLRFINGLYAYITLVFSTVFSVIYSNLLFLEKAF